MPPPNCSEIKQEFEHLKSLKEEFDLSLDSASTGAKTPEEARSALEKLNSWTKR